MLQWLLKHHRQVIHQSVNLIGLIMLASPLLFGVSQQYLWGIFAGILMSTFVASAYYHRALTHRSWKPNKLIHYVFLTLGAGFWLMPALYWVAIHRKHHKFYDTDKDPHGPKVGFWKNLLMVMNDPEPRFLKTDMKNQFMRWQNDNYLTIAFMCLAIAMFTYPIFYLTTVGYVYLAFFVVNNYGHYQGTRDSHILSLLCGGEMYHRKHHADQNDPKFGILDLGYYGLIKWVK